MLPFSRSSDHSVPRSRSDRVREEQAFYESHANAEPWKVALKQFAPIPLGLIFFATLVALSHALR
jgi:hypothetical protein